MDFDQGTDSPCKLFDGFIDRDGYGRYRGDMAHRYFYKEYHKLKDKDIRGLVVRHTCDVRNCVNPLHLRLGTQKDNIYDMIAKGRKFYGKGDTAPNTKLTQAIANEIRSAVGTQAAIAAHYGTDQGTVSRIKRGLLW